MSAVSVVTPSLNQGAFIEQTIRSVIRQDYPSIEYIVMDGGSEDESLSILEKYSEKLSYWESTADRGQAHAINKGWRRSTGKYLCWLNADDVLPPRSIQAAVEFLDEHKEIDFVYGNVLLIDEQGLTIQCLQVPEFDLAVFATQYKSIPQPGSLMRASVINKIGYLDDGFHFVMDRQYWLRLALSGGHIGKIDAVLAMQRIHAGAKTQIGSPLGVKERYRCAELVLGHPNAPESILSKASVLWSNTFRVCARVYMKCGLYGLALRETWKSIRFSPKQIAHPEIILTINLSIFGLVFSFGRVQALRKLRRRILRCVR